MIGTILGTKLNQSQKFTEDGRRIPVTTVIAGPCPVIMVKNNGSQAVQLGFGTRRVKTVKKPNLGHLKKAGQDTTPPRFLRDVRISTDLKQIDTDNLPKVGDIIKVGDVLKVGDKVQVTGVSKGKGFQGGVRRYHFKGGPRTHGQSDRERAPGSIGQTTTPGRVYKGKKMAGRMGNDKVTLKNIQVVSVDAEKNIVTLSGLIPGGRDNLVVIQKI
ncbi:MAG: 50S ribosomal protein L3 [Candidatus Gottesmanbacteria bacterium GW2011_GWA2_41_12]|uniref:Large ribosomal subunit protein uL3 n=2 Tax=Candidatus Gottesmaniibacteriota TaxID=1752720 RepID=A0A0G0UI67_9BACT|nr:MAG: 50S ribosomal protein L3 [Candidatus Gottesmanbacteria bacterium GW2011_GWC2_39_8]KKR88519.1 MAG: 50S ribosomal protein L3 [Candidatus Gottesmanbacteria bacterium GW2011_GWA2_41_12]